MITEDYYKNIPADQDLLTEFEKENKYWMILESDHPVYPYMDEDDSVRLYRREKDARDFLTDHALEGFCTLYLEEEELAQMVSTWTLLGVKELHIYGSDRDFDRTDMGDYAPDDARPIREAEGLPAMIMKGRQGAGEDTGWQKPLIEELADCSLLLPVQSGTDTICLLDDPLIEGNYLGLFTSRRLFRERFPEADARLVPFSRIRDRMESCDGIIIDPGFHGVNCMLKKEQFDG